MDNLYRKQKGLKLKTNNNFLGREIQLWKERQELEKYEKERTILQNKNWKKRFAPVKREYTKAKCEEHYLQNLGLL